MDLLSLSIGFVVGTFTGAAGHYFGEKYTDKRRNKEAKESTSKEWEEICTKFPNTISEMRKDTVNPNNEFIREFFVVESGLVMGKDKSSFIYSPYDIPDLLPAIEYLVDLAFIEDITPGKTAKYRMKERLVDLLRQ